MSFRELTSKTFDFIQEHGKKSIRKLAEATKSNKSSVGRQVKAIRKRSEVAGSSFFESTAGQEWLQLLVFASIYIFGFKSGVGAERISEFLVLINIGFFAGVSPTAVRKLFGQVGVEIIAYRKAQENILQTLASTISICAGADETFFENLTILIFMDLASGYIFLEKASCNRTHATWEKNVNPLVSFFKEIKYLVSDGARALAKLGKKTLQCEIIADLFHMLQKVVSLFRFSFAAKLRSLEKQYKIVTLALIFSMRVKSSTDSLWLQLRLLKKINDSEQIIIDEQKQYHAQLINITTSVHPFNLDSSTRHTTKDVVKKLNSSLLNLKDIAKICNISDKKKKLKYFEKRIKLLSQSIDSWWLWVEQNIDNDCLSTEERTWIFEYLLPMIYWEQQSKKSKYSKKLRQVYKDAYEKAKTKLEQHKLTKDLFTTHWYEWARWITSKFQRTTSAIEGRNGHLAQFYHCIRGFSETRLEVLSIVHNFDLRREDGTTAAERLFKTKFPDLFEWILNNVGELPLARKRRKTINSTCTELS